MRILNRPILMKVLVNIANGIKARFDDNQGELRIERIQTERRAFRSGSPHDSPQLGKNQQLFIMLQNRFSKRAVSV